MARIIPVVVIALVFLSGCSPKAGETVVATVGDTPITLREYENLMLKSSGGPEEVAASTPGEREEFLRLMTNFRLKLKDAYASGLERRPEIQAEIRQYRGSLAQSFLTEREVTAPGVRRLFERRNEEIRASHILISLPPQVSPEDSAMAYAKAADVIRRLQAGAVFGDLAAEISQDPSVAQNRGDLYYFTAGQMVPPFEDAVYAMKTGEITTTPVRTPYGLHIVKVTDRKPAPGEVQCSHIMVRFDRQDPAPEDTLAAFEKIRALEDSLRQGADFSGLAQRHSQDPGSAARGGDLGWFGRRRWVQAFDEVALTLTPGQTSGIVRTIYGYHLIRCFDARPPKPFAEAEKDVQQMYQQVRFQDDFRAYTNRLRQENGYALNAPAAERFFSSLDSTKTMRDTAWASGIEPDLAREWLLRFTGRTITVDSAVAVMRNRPDFVNTSLRRSSMQQALDKVADQLVFEVKAGELEGRSPDFASLMKEYSEGILLYQVEQDRVWNRIAVTDSALQGYFGAHREDFRHPDRANIGVLRMANDSLASLAHHRLLAATPPHTLVREDSLRMARPYLHEVKFTKRSPAVPPSARPVFAAFVEEMRTDPALRITATAYHDTAGPKSPSEKLAMARLKAVRDLLVKTLRADDGRVATQTKIPPRGTADTTLARLMSVVNVELGGRRPHVLGFADDQLLPVDADERAARADSLAPGTWSAPFLYEGAVHLVRLNRKEPSRLKTFEEAGTEVSSAFQEYESKRLEREWLERLRAQYPVTTNPAALQQAFVPAAP